MTQQFPYGLGYGTFNAIDYYYGNSGAVADQKEPTSHKTRKHIEVKYCLFAEIVR